MNNMISSWGRAFRRVFCCGPGAEEVVETSGNEPIYQSLETLEEHQAHEHDTANTLQSVVEVMNEYGTRHIIEALVLAGYDPFKSLLICGGITKDPLFVQIQADAVGLPILKPHEKDSVLVGSAILGACASQYFNSVQDAIENMGGTADVIQPNMAIKSYHDKKYRVFLRMFQDQLKYKTVMTSNL